MHSRRPITRERRKEIVDQLTQESSPGFDYFVLVLLSCVIATLGLLENSAAVIIGAMLVAPLMSPILGVSLASVTGRRPMFQKAAWGLLEGALAAVALSLVVGWMGRALPMGELGNLPTEVIARTRPGPFDLIIALAGGAAASYALAQPALSAALPGVAIATALMPPLCTIGIGVAFGRWDVAGGALLLFLTNLAAIAFAGIAVFAALGFRPSRAAETEQQVRSSLMSSAALVLVVAIPLSLLSAHFVGETRLRREVQNAVVAELATRSGSQLVDIAILGQTPALHLLVTIQSPVSLGFAEALSLQEALAVRLERPLLLELVVIPTTRLDPRIPPTRTPTSTPGPGVTPAHPSTITITPAAGNGGVGFRSAPVRQDLAQPPARLTSDSDIPPPEQPPRDQCDHQGRAGETGQPLEVHPLHCLCSLVVGQG